MLRQVIAISLFYPLLSYAGALNVCVFDGGGANPLCGREVYNTGIDYVYQSKSVARIDFLSGDGNNPAMIVESSTTKK